VLVELLSLGVRCWSKTQQELLACLRLLWLWNRLALMHVNQWVQVKVLSEQQLERALEFMDREPVDVD